jgi:hypothetical protein
MRAEGTTKEGTTESTEGTEKVRVGPTKPFLGLLWFLSLMTHDRAFAVLYY